MPSSVILKMEYQPLAGLLTIHFRGDRGVYRYFDVPMDVWTAFRGSKSKGTYLNEVFKEYGFRYDRVGLVVGDEQREQNEDDGGKRDAQLLRWPGPEPGADGGDSDGGKADDLDGLARGHQTMPATAFAASLRRSVSS